MLNVSNMQYIESMSKIEHNFLIISSTINESNIYSEILEWMLSTDPFIFWW